MKTFTLVFLIFSIILFFAFFGLIVALILPWNDSPDVGAIKLHNYNTLIKNENAKIIESDIRRKPINPNTLYTTTLNPVDAVIIKKIVESGILDNNSKIKESTLKPEITSTTSTTTTTTSPETTTTPTTTPTTTQTTTESPTTTKIIETTPSTTKTTTKYEEIIFASTYQPATRRKHRPREKAVTLMLSNSLLRKFLKSENNLRDALHTLPPIIESTTRTPETPSRQLSFPPNSEIKDEINQPLDFSELSRVGISKIEQVESPFEALQRSRNEKILLSPVTLPTIKTTEHQPSTTVYQLKTHHTLPPSIIVSPSNQRNNEEFSDEIITSSKEGISTEIMTTQLPLRSTSQPIINITSKIKNLPNKSKYVPLNLLSTIESPSPSKPTGLVIVDDILFLGKLHGVIEIYNKTSLEYLSNIIVNLTINQISILSDDTLIVNDASNSTLNLVNFNGDVMRRLELPYKNKGVTVNQDMIFVLPTSGDEIFIYNPDLSLYKNISFPNVQEESCNFLAPTPQYIYLVCESHIKKLNYDGELIKELGRGKGTYVYNIKYDYRTNTLYAIEKNESSIHVFNEDTGEHFKLLDEDISLTLYNDIILDEDKLYVSDFQNNLIKVFTFDSYLVDGSEK
uniref:Olfactomedin-like domain-containing protein n=1 Tax=Strongyloides papillosus TaxID=174720 RepID=A0A0N5CGR4_STREA